MKLTLLFICAITVFTTTGCLVREGGRHRHSEVVVVGAPVVVVHPVVVHPVVVHPVVIVH